MKKQESESKPITKKTKTSSEITSKLLATVNEQISKQVTLGKIAVNPISTILPNPKRNDFSLSTNPQDSLQGVELNLKAIRSSIIEQKKAQKQEEKMKLAKALQLIERMKKEKEEYQQKMKEKNDRGGLERRLYSDTALHKMRAKLEERIALKRLEIEQRVKAIQERKMKRDEKIAGQQNQYWQSIKDVKQKAKSSSRLPSLNKESRESNTSLPHKSSLKHLLAVNPSEESFLKWKEENSKLKPIQQRNFGILQKLKGSHKNLSRRLHAQEVILNEFIPYHVNKHKLMGDEFLKESLLMAKKSRVTNIEEEGPIRDSIEVQAHEAQMNPNEKVEKMKEKWERTLSKIKHREIGKEQGLDLLNNIEKRLDRIDLQGVKERLKKKYQIFDQMEL